MRILVAVDQHTRSTQTLNQVRQLLVNTWANVTLLGVVPPSYDDGGIPMAFVNTMDDYHQSVLDAFDRDCPYPKDVEDYELAQIRPVTFEKIGEYKSGLKDLTVRISVGEPVRTILEEAQESGSDLIVLHGDMDSQQKIAVKAECSVLIVKEGRDDRNILCLFDNDLVSQKSLEMITQMTTLFDADIEIAGLTEKRGIDEQVENKIDWLLRYFDRKDVQTWIELVALSSLEKFVLQEDHWSLITMWTGETSIIERLFSVNKVAQLLKSSRSSVLLLR